MNKRIFALITAVVMAAALACSVFAAPEAVPFNTMVVDIPGVLTAEEAKELNDRAWKLTQQYECAVYIVINDNLNGIQAWEFNEAIHREYKMGYGPDKSCVILLLSMNEREYDIMAHGYGNTAFTDYGKDEMANGFLFYFKDNDWYGGFTEYLDCCEKYLEMARSGEPFDIDTDSELSLIMAVICIGIACVIAFVVCTVFKMQMKTAVKQSHAGMYIDGRGLVLSGKSDRYTHTVKTKRYIEPKKPSSGSRGGTTVNRNGSSHRSGRF